MRDEALGLRDLAKSMMSCAWAISIFGIRQMTSLLSAPGNAQAKKLAQAVDKLTDAATGTFDDSAQTIYRAGTSIQNAVIDVTLGRAIGAAPVQPHTSGEQTQPPIPEPKADEDWILKVQ